MAQIRRYDEIMQSAVANMTARQDKVTDFNEGSIIHTLLDTVARLTERAYVAIRQGYNKQLAILPYSPFKFSKKDGFFASGTVIFSRDSALGSVSVIPKGTKISGGGSSFTTTETGNIIADTLNSGPIKCIADTRGISSNVAANTIDSIDSNVPADVVSVTNSVVFTGGTDAETDAEFEDRFKVYINGLSGTNSYAIKNAALSVNGIRSVSVQNHKPPLNDIYNMSIYVDDGSGSATDEVIQEVKLAIEGDGTEKNQGHIAPGINVRVITPISISVDMAITVSIYGIDLEKAKAEIRNVITAKINALTIGNPVILSEIITKVMALQYVKDVAITSPTVNVEPSISQIVRMRTLDLTLVEVE